MELLSRFFGPSFRVLWLSLKWGITTAYAATPSEEALLAHYLSYEGDPDYVRFVYEELQRAATLGAYDEALRMFLKAVMLLSYPLLAASIPILLESHQ